MQSSNKNASSLNKKYRISINQKQMNVKMSWVLSLEIKVQQSRNHAIKIKQVLTILKSLPADEKPENGYKISKLHCESLEMRMFFLILALEKYL